MMGAPLLDLAAPLGSLNRPAELSWIVNGLRTSIPLRSAWAAISPAARTLVARCHGAAAIERAAMPPAAVPNRSEAACGDRSTPSFGDRTARKIAFSTRAPHVMQSATNVDTLARLCASTASATFVGSLDGSIFWRRGERRQNAH